MIKLDYKCIAGKLSDCHKPSTLVYLQTLEIRAVQNYYPWEFDRKVPRIVDLFWTPFPP